MCNGYTLNVYFGPKIQMPSDGDLCMTSQNNGIQFPYALAIKQNICCGLKFCFVLNLILLQGCNSENSESILHYPCQIKRGNPNRNFYNSKNFIEMNFK